MANIVLPKNTSYIVYFNGYRVPCSQVTVSSSVGAPSTANITIPASPVMHAFGSEDRVQVSIFYLDSWDHEEEPKWCLLFEGYLGGYAYSGSPTSRSMNFNASSNIQVLSTLYLEFLGGGSNVAGRRGRPDPIVPSEVTFRGKYPNQLFTKGLTNKGTITRPYEIIENVFLATTGQFRDRNRNTNASSSEINDEVERVLSVYRLNLQNHLDSLEGEQAKANYRADQRASLYRRSFDEGLDISPSEGAPLEEIQKQILTEQLTRSIQSSSVTLRTPSNTGFFKRYFDLTKLPQHFVASPLFEGNPGSGDSASTLPSGAFPMLRTRRGKRYARAMVRQTGYKYGAGGSVWGLISNLFAVFNYGITDLLAPPIYEVDDNSLPSGAYNAGSKKNRIATHITKPSAIYSLPPACNVIFPCMLRGWTLQQDYEAAPTRVYYNRRSQGNRLKIDSRKAGYAYSGGRIGYPAVIARHAQDSSNSARSDLELLVFPEEYYRGPNPNFSEINPLFYEIGRLDRASRVRVDDIEAEAEELNQDDSIRADQLAQMREAFQRARASGEDNFTLYSKQAQVDYETQRSAASSCQAQLVFNPYLVAGYGGMLLDTEEVGLHMMGYVQQVAHSLSQDGSMTSVALTNARPVRDVVLGIYRDGARYDMSPVEPVRENRLLQKFESANLYYENALYRSRSGDIVPNADVSEALANQIAKEYQLAVARQDLTEASSLAEDPTTTERQAPLEAEVARLEGEVAAILRQASGQATENTTSSNAVANYSKLLAVYSRDIDDRSDIFPLDFGAMSSVDRLSRIDQIAEGILVPREGSEKFFSSLVYAMKYVKRPVCTLDQYIDFYASLPSFDGVTETLGGRGKGVAGAPSDEIVPGAQRAPVLIREFIGGPGYEPGSLFRSGRLDDGDDENRVPGQLTYLTVEGGEVVEKVFAVFKPETKVRVSQLPDSRLDWVKVLRQYKLLIDNTVTRARTTRG